MGLRDTYHMLALHIKGKHINHESQIKPFSGSHPHSSVSQTLGCAKITHRPGENADPVNQWLWVATRKLHLNNPLQVMWFWCGWSTSEKWENSASRSRIPGPSECPWVLRDCRITPCLNLSMPARAEAGCLLSPASCPWPSQFSLCFGSDNDFVCLLSSLAPKDGGLFLFIWNPRND